MSHKTTDDYATALLGGGHYAPDRTGEYGERGFWWSDHFQQWFPVTFQGSTAEIEVIDDAGMKVGCTFIANMFGKPGVLKSKFVVRLNARGGSVILEECEFYRTMGPNVDDITGYDKENARQVLGGLHQHLLASGFMPEQRGAQWYSYRYQVPTLVSDAPPDVYEKWKAGEWP